MAAKFPETTIGGVKMSRLLIGTNMFGGWSHISAARDTWLRNYFTTERIVEVLAACTERGLNGMVSPVLPKFADALKMHEDKTGRTIHWVATPGNGGGPTGATIEEEIDWAAAHGAKFILPHPCWTDTRIMVEKREIVGLDDIIKRVRGHGLVPGVSTHLPETVVVCDKHPYDVETYIQILNVAGFLMHIETDWCAKVVQEAKHPVLCIKPLASGRVLPATGFRWTYENSKPEDVVVAGFMSVEEAMEDIDICLEVLTGRKYEAVMQVTRSKRALVK